MNNIIKKFMLIFLLIAVTSAGYCGFFLKWSFRDGDPELGFEVMLEGTAKRPFVHRQLLPVVVKKSVEILPEQTKEKLRTKLENKNQLENLFAQSHVQKKFLLEYYLMYVLCFILFFAAICILRLLLIEVTQDKFSATLGACLFAILFPFLEVVGGYYYDFGEVFFFFTAVLLALRKNFIALILITPFAEFNKESFLFFAATLFPFLGLKKTFSLMFIAGLSYLYVKNIFINNPGDSADLQLWNHLDQLFDVSSYFMTASTYGLPLPTRIFFLHVVYVVWIIKNFWCKLSDGWKMHAKIALIINSILYFMFVVPGELRDLSMLYVSFMILTTYFIKELKQ